MNKSLVLNTDSYKFGSHFNMMPKNTTDGFSYWESRVGAEFPKTVFFGLQYILKSLFEGKVVTQEDIDLGEFLAEKHLGNKSYFNKEGWQYILDNHDGKLPLEICAVEEGVVVPNNNVIMTVANTDEKSAWLVNYVETVLSHLWYPSTVATKTLNNITNIIKHLKKASDLSPSSIETLARFMVHDFGMRSTTSLESSAIGGAAHLTSSFGTDTISGILLLKDYYYADLENDIMASVPASEHSIATARGEQGELEYFEDLLDKYPSGILSIVIDSYDTTRFINEYALKLKDKILRRAKENPGSRVVFRPDSPRFEDDEPHIQCVDIHLWLDRIFGSTINSKGYKVLNPAVGVIYGDSLSDKQIDNIYNHLVMNNFSPENQVVGQGGGLLQKINRDTQRFAFKSSAQKRDGVWHDLAKKPKDSSKASKGGRMTLVYDLENREVSTVNIDNVKEDTDIPLLRPVFKNGEILEETSLSKVRENVNTQIQTLA